MNAAKVVLAIDTSDITRAEELVKLAKENGGRVVKFGLELSSAHSWKACADLAKEYQMEWVADAKLDDIPHTVERTILNLLQLNLRPLGITVHIKAGEQTLRQAQAVAGDTIIFGVTELTAISEVETKERYGVERPQFVEALLKAAQKSGIKGAVVSGHEISAAESYGLTTLVPGIRSANASEDDQANTMTPRQALDAGADYIVIGRQITNADDPQRAYQELVAEIEV